MDAIKVYCDFSTDETIRAQPEDIESQELVQKFQGQEACLGGLINGGTQVRNFINIPFPTEYCLALFAF